MGNCVLKYINYYQNKQFDIDENNKINKKRKEVHDLRIEVQNLEREVLEMRNKKLQIFVDNHSIFG